MPALDGSVGPTNFAAATSSAVTLSTANANDVVFLFIVLDVNTGFSTSVVGGGLTWILRTRLVPSGSIACELWYAIAPTALSGVTITATYSVSTATTLTACGVANPSPVWPFDEQSAQPATGTGTSLSPAATFSTLGPNDLVLCFLGMASTEATITQPGGLTLIGTQGTTAPSAGAAWEAVTSPQTGVTLTWSATTSRIYGVIVDAVQGPFPQNMVFGQDGAITGVAVFVARLARRIGRALRRILQIPTAGGAGNVYHPGAPRGAEQ